MINKLHECPLQSCHLGQRAAHLWPQKLRFLKRPRPKEAHRRARGVSALSLMGIGFSFLTTGKNINTGRWEGGGNVARAWAPGPGSGKGGLIFSGARPGSRWCRLALVLGPPEAPLGARATAKIPGCGSAHRGLSKRGDKTVPLAQRTRGPRRSER